MGSSLDEEYSVIHVAAKATWYIPGMRWIRGGASVRIAGERVGWVVGWACRRGFSGCGFVIGV